MFYVLNSLIFMKIYLLNITFIFFVISIYGQNLIPNPSFENIKKMPCTTAITSEEFNERLLDWTSPTKGSSDVFNSDVDDNTCPWTSTNRKTKPRTGKSMAGFITSTNSSGREYLQAKLISPLVIGKTYEIEFWVSRNAQSYKNATNNIGVFFSDERIGNELKTRLEVIL